MFGSSKTTTISSWAWLNLRCVSANPLVNSERKNPLKTKVEF